ncbi:MAG: hypothetical protein IJ138_10120 [Clostridia bacterium]|nr:hypothetical protein [Clostridia bacterium]
MYDTKERYINLRDLFFHILFRWRSILLVAVALMLVMGGYRVWRNQSVRAAQESADKTPSAISEQEQLSIQQAEQAVKDAQASLDELVTYNNESVWLHLDPAQETVGVKQFYIRLDEYASGIDPASATRDETAYVAGVYTSTLLRQMSEDTLKHIFGTDRLEYVNELASLVFDRETHGLTLTVIGSDEETVRQQIAALTESMYAEIKPIAEQVAPHTLVALSETYSVRIDTSLSNRQHEVEMRLIVLQGQLLDKTKEYEQIVPASGGTAIAGLFTGVKKYLLVGFVLGGFVMVVFYAMTYLFGDKLHSVNELGGKDGAVPLFGEVYTSRGRRKGKGIDGLIERWETRGKQDNEAVFRRIHAMLTEQYAGKTVLLTGTISESSMRQILDALASCSEADVRLVMQPDFLHNEQAVVDAKQADAVLIAEQKHVSRMREIEKMGAALRALEVYPDGCILL